MHFKALKYILKKDKQSVSLIQSWCQVLSTEIYVTLADGTIMYGEPSDKSHQFKLENGEVQVAVLHANTLDGGQQIMDLISLLYRKELDKKRVGTEVLGLYREINMIYDFSEQISEKIDIPSIANIALKEATKIIKSSNGLVLLYNQELDEVRSVASIGDNPLREDHIFQQNMLLKEFVLHGQSAIVPSNRLSENPATRHLKSMMYAPLKVKDRSLGLLMVGHQTEKEFTAAELKLITTIALQSASAIDSALLYEKGLKDAQEREEAIREIHEVSLKFVPFEFIKSLGKKSLTEVALDDQVEREVTVLFADIRGFTSLSENMSPSDNFLFINSFNKKMGPIVRANNGFILQYLGDGFMAIFPGGSQDAVKASVDMHDHLKTYNNKREAKQRKPIVIGIGMQNGNLIMGITGDVERLDAAIISDTVNTASRIEGLSKHYGTSILLTGECYKTLTDPEQFDFRYLGLVQVKGKQIPLELYECINGDEDDLFKHKTVTLDTFKEGLDYFFQKEFAMAAVTFQQIVKLNAKDQTARLYLNRSAKLITEEISDDWQGVESVGNG